MSALRVHWSLSSRVSTEELETVINQCPNGLREKDVNGKLPLHIAAELNVSKDLIILLIGKYSHALMAADNNGMLPIHHLAKVCTELNVYQEVVNHYPECFKMKDQDGWLPIHHAARDNQEVLVIQYLVRLYAGGLCIRTLHSSLPLHCAAHNNTSSAAVKYLISQYPEALREPGKQGMLPLHYAARSNTSMEVICILTNAYPAAVLAKDSAGRLSVHYATRNSAVGLEIVSFFAEICPEVLQVSDNNGWLCLHYAARFSSNHKLLQYLTKTCPRAVIERDKEGWLPIHHAALGASSVQGIKALVDVHPAIALAKACGTTKFCHELAPVGSSKQTFLFALYLSLGDAEHGEITTSAAFTATPSSTSQPASQVSILRVHLLGDSLAGKSTLKHWLVSSSAQGVADYSGKWGDWFEKATHDISTLHGRTAGVDTSVVHLPINSSSLITPSSSIKEPLSSAATEHSGNVSQTPSAGAASPSVQRQLLLYDYGGKELFHSLVTQQARYFHQQDIRDHLYVIVLPLFDKDSKVQFSGAQLKVSLLRWLKLLHSSVSKQAQRRFVMILVNTFASEGVMADTSELCSMLLREARRCYSIAILADGDDHADLSTDFVLLHDIRSVDIRSKVQCRAVIESIQTHYFTICTTMFTQSRLYAHVCKLLDSINMSLDMFVEDYKGIVCSSIQSFYTQKGNLGLGVIDNEVCSYLFDQVMRMLLLSDRVRLINYPEGFVLNDASSSHRILITSPSLLLSSVYGELIYNIYNRIQDTFQSNAALNSSFRGLSNVSTLCSFILPISSILNITSQVKSSNLIKLLVDLRLCIPVLYNASTTTMRGAGTLDIFYNHVKYSLDSSHCLCFVHLLNQALSTEQLDSLHAGALRTMQEAGEYTGIGRAYVPQHLSKSTMPPGYFSSLCYLLYMKFGVAADDLQINKNVLYLCTADKHLLILCCLLEQDDKQSVVLRLYTRAAPSQAEDVYHLLASLEREMVNDYSVSICVFCLSPFEAVGSIQLGMRSCCELEEDWLINCQREEENEDATQLLFGRAYGKAPSETNVAAQDSIQEEGSHLRVALTSTAVPPLSFTISVDGLARALLASSVKLTPDNEALCVMIKKVLVSLQRNRALIWSPDQDNNAEFKQQVSSISKHSLQLLWTDVLQRAQTFSALAHTGGMSTGLESITYPVALPVLTRVQGDKSLYDSRGESKLLCVYRLSFMCAVCGKQCAQCGREQQEYSLFSLGEVGPDILTALSPSVHVLEALLAVKNPPYLVLEWASALQDTLDIMLSFAVDLASPKGHSKGVGRLEVYRDRERLQRIQSGMFTLIKSFLSSGKNSTLFASVQTPGSSVLSHIKGYTPPDVIYDANYIRCVRTLFCCVSDTHLMHSGLQVLCSSGVYAFVCGSSKDMLEGKGVRRANEESEPAPAVGVSNSVSNAKSTYGVPSSSSLCIDQFLKRGSDALAYNIVM
ncbi:ankyrin repeat domain-containing protein [archaeon]|nr:MAG: ankyrin repeat domain-containing protein [archaeon]